MGKFVVTGGAGFIGSHVVDYLINNSNDVLILDNLSTGRLENINPKANFANVDIGKCENLNYYLENIDGVFHLAALPRIQPSFQRPMEHHEVNITATLNLLSGMNKASVKNLVISSSSSCYGNPSIYPTPETADIRPLNPYALQKYCSEQYALLLGKFYGIKVNAVRYFNAFGPRSFNPENPDNAYSSVIGIFSYNSINNLPIQITGNGLQRRDFVHVSDIARANYLIMESNSDGEVFNIGFGKTYSILDIAKLFSENFKFIPNREGEAEITHADITKIKNEINWHPKIDVKYAIHKGLL